MSEDESIKQQFFNQNNYSKFVMPLPYKNTPANEKHTTFRYSFKIDNDMKLGVPVGNQLIMKVVSSNFKENQVQTLGFDKYRLWKVQPIYSAENSYFEIMIDKHMLQLWDKQQTETDVSMQFKGPRGHIRYLQGLQFQLNMDTVEFKNVIFICDRPGLPAVYNILNNFNQKHKKENKLNNDQNVQMFQFEENVENIILFDEINKLTISIPKFKPHLLLKQSQSTIKGINDGFQVEVYEEKAYQRVISEVLERYKLKLMAQSNDLGCFISGCSQFSTEMLMAVKSLNFNINNVILF